MSQVRRIQRYGTPWVAVALIALLAGCNTDNAGGAQDPTAGTGGDSNFDGAGGSGATGGAEAAGGNGGLILNGNLEVTDQNPVEVLVADPDRSAWDVLTDAGVSSPNEYASRAATCYATADACSTPGCSVFATCCVGNGTCCKPVADAPLPLEVDFGDCSGLDIGSCSANSGTSASAFGPSQPLINSRGLVPGGNATSEGGAVIGDSTDLGTTRVRVDVEFALPIGCGASCLESAGVAFSNTTPGTFVDADVGLLLSGSRKQVNLMIGNAVAETFDAGNGQTRWALILSPEGQVEVLRNDMVEATHTFDASMLRQAALVLFGRNLSAPTNSAAIGRIAIENSFCDIPSAWDVRDPVTVTDAMGNPFDGQRFGRGPSVASDGQEIRFAYGIDGEIFWARSGDVGVVQRIGTFAALSPSYAHEALGVQDPELVYDGNDWHAFYTAYDANGTGSIGHAAANPTDSFFTADAAPTLSATGDAVSLDAPTVQHQNGLWILIVRATLASGATELRAYYTGALGTTWEPVVDSSLEALTRVATPGSEITGPSLIVHNSGYQLYFAKRSGTRWAVELLTSDELLLWRPLGEVLGASDGGFDRLGARAPDAISLTDRVDLVYEGQNAISFELGWGVRSAPSDTAPAF